MTKQLTQASAATDFMGQDDGAYRLVDGIFDPAQATEVLMTLIEDKIRFHQRNNLTSHERCGHSDPASTRRIDELRQCKAELIARIAEAESCGQRLAINCTMTIAPIGN